MYPKKLKLGVFSEYMNGCQQINLVVHLGEKVAKTHSIHSGYGLARETNVNLKITQK